MERGYTWGNTIPGIFSPLNFYMFPGIDRSRTGRGPSLALSGGPSLSLTSVPSCAESAKVLADYVSLKMYLVVANIEGGSVLDRPSTYNQRAFELIPVISPGLPSE